jgi:hypothetical protein
VRKRLLPGLKAIPDRLFVESRFRAMLCQSRGVACCYFGELSFKDRGNVGMKLLATAAQERALSGVLHQRMLECVLRVGWRPATKDQLGSHKLGQG